MCVNMLYFVHNAQYTILVSIDNIDYNVIRNTSIYSVAIARSTSPLFQYA